MLTKLRTTAVALACLTVLPLAACSNGDDGDRQDLAGGAPSTVATPSTPADLRNLGSTIQLTVPDPTFTAGSWAPGIIYDASGFAPGSQVTIFVATLTSPSQMTTQQQVVYADGSGNLSSAWSPTTLPQAPAADKYPVYEAFAVQDGNATTPAKVTNTVFLTINP